MPAPSGAPPAAGPVQKKNKQPAHQEHNPEDLDWLERLRRENRTLKEELLRVAPERLTRDLGALLDSLSLDRHYTLESVPETKACDRFQPRVGSWPNDRFRTRADSPESLVSEPRNVVKKNKIRSRSPSPTESAAARSRPTSPGLGSSAVGGGPGSSLTEGSPYGEALRREDLLTEMCLESQKLLRGLRDAAEEFLRQHDELADKILRGGQAGSPCASERRVTSSDPLSSLRHDLQKARTAIAPASGPPWAQQLASQVPPQEKADFSGRREIAEKQQPKHSGDAAEDCSERDEEEGKDELEKPMTGPSFHAITPMTPAHPIEDSTIDEKIADINKQKAAEFGPWAVTILDKIEAFEKMRSEEPEPTGKLAEILASNQFSVVCIIVILANALFLAVWTDYSVSHPTEKPTLAMYFAEFTFLSFYCSELTLKLYVRRKFFFIGHEWKWNMFDGLVVLISVFELLIENFSEGDEAQSITNISFLRAWRMFKLARVLRVFKQWESVTEVRLMMEILASSMPSLFWAILLLVFITFLFGILFVQAVGQRALQNVQDPTQKVSDGLLDNFGSVQVAMVSLFEVVTGGNDWHQYYNYISEISTAQGFVFLFYIAFFHIAVWNIMTSIFIDRTMKLAAPDMDNLIYEKTKKDAKDLKEMMDLMRILDIDHSSSVSFDEFLTYMSHERFRMYFTIRGLEVKDTQTFFHMLQSINGEEAIDLKHFVKSCMKMKGGASSIDVQILHYECKRIRSEQARVHKYLEELLALHAQVRLPPFSGGPSPSSTTVPKLPLPLHGT